ncbi:MAG: glycosyl hydrolase family 18 protein, partial [Myxococcota bacterium]
VGYQPTWSGLDPDTVRFEALTHVCLAFANPVGDTDEFEFSDVTPAEVAAFVARAHAEGVEVLGSIGGGYDSPRLVPYLEPDRVADTVAAVVDLVARHGLDGIDVDIEGEAISATYEPFVTALAEALEDHTLTAAVATWNGDDVSDVALAAYDFVNVMSYDQCGPWSGPCPHSTLAAVDADLGYWVDQRGVPADAAVLGVPFYGYCWGAACPGEYLGYREIVAQWPEWADQDWVEAPDLRLSLNGPTTIAAKRDIGRAYGGVMAWELSLDTSGDDSLLDVLVSRP